MIFEDLTTRKGHDEGNHSCKLLLSKYRELKKFQEVYKQSNKIQKQKLRQPRVKQNISNIINVELEKRLNPEETFEVWHEFDINKNLLKLKDQNLDEKIFNALKSDAKDEDESTIKQNSMTEKFNHFIDKYDASTKFARTNFIIETNGLEVLPMGQRDDSQTDSIQRHDLTNLTTLLHLNILRKNWTIAYKIFCLLLRFPNVDIRIIWPLGIEILTNLSSRNKIEKLFQYLTTFHMSFKRSSATLKSSMSIMAPVWRSGSITLVPIYLISSLWFDFTQGKYDRVSSRINELILEPPYDAEGTLFYIQSLCYLYKGYEMVQAFEVQDNLDQALETHQPFRTHEELAEELINLKSLMMKNLTKCRLVNFEVPDFEVMNFMNNLIETADSRNLSEDEAEEIHSSGESIISDVNKDSENINPHSDVEDPQEYEVETKFSNDFMEVGDVFGSQKNIDESFDDDDEVIKKFDTFDLRRNSLELYPSRHSSAEPEKKNTNNLRNEQTMIDFDFDFDSE